MRNLRPPSDFGGRAGRCGVQVGCPRRLGSPFSSSSLSEVQRRRSAGHAARMLELGGRFRKAGRRRFDQRRVQQRGKVVAERMHLRPRRLGTGFGDLRHAPKGILHLTNPCQVLGFVSTKSRLPDGQRSSRSLLPRRDGAFARLEAIVWPNGPVCPFCGNVGKFYALAGVLDEAEQEEPRRCRSPRPQEVRRLPQAVHGPQGYGV